MGQLFAPVHDVQWSYPFCVIIDPIFMVCCGCTGEKWSATKWIHVGKLPSLGPPVPCVRAMGLKFEMHSIVAMILHYFFQA